MHRLVADKEQPANAWNIVYAFYDKFEFPLSKATAGDSDQFANSFAHTLGQTTASLFFGEKVAKIAAAHENFALFGSKDFETNKVIFDTAIDLMNNEYGRKLGSSLKAKYINNILGQR